jgi:putative transposase
MLDAMLIPFYRFRMKVKKGIVIRVKPNTQQRELLAKHFGANRWLWNYFLNKRRTEYTENKLSSTYVRDCAELTKLKQSGEYLWLYEVSTKSQQRTLKHLDDTYKRFFKGNAKFPRFKSKRHDQSFAVAGDIKIKNNRVILPKFPKGLKFNRELPAFTKINNITIRKTASGKYYAVLSEAIWKQSPY